MVKKQYPYHPIVGVGAVIVDNGKILLEKRGNEPAKGKWSIPGGVVELGENLEDTVLRETFEETGLHVKNPILIDVISQIDFDSNDKVKYHFIIVDYLVTVTGGDAKAASDADDLSWVKFDDVLGYDLTDSFRKFFIKNSKLFESL